MKESALAWIVGILNKNKIPFSVCGGLAANFYGSERPLNDIDLFVPGQCFDQVVKAGTNHISKPAQHYCEEAEGWDLEYVQFIYDGIKIEVGSAHKTKIFDAEHHCWQDLPIDFENTVKSTIFGSPVSVMPVADLIRYKTQLGREVDKLDVAAISNTRDCGAR